MGAVSGLPDDLTIDVDQQTVRFCLEQLSTYLEKRSSKWAPTKNEIDTWTPAATKLIIKYAPRIEKWGLELWCGALAALYVFQRLEWKKDSKTKPHSSSDGQGKGSQA